MVEYSKEDTIFVQIASYRDPELQHTLRDLFAKAKKPENIFVGICHQYDMKEQSDKHLFEITFPRPNQLRIDEVDYRDAKGLFFARSKTQNLYAGEKWTVQFDSHMRFEKNWDEILVKMAKTLQEKGFAKPIVASYPPGYDPETNKLDEKFVSFLRIKDFFKESGIIRMTGINHGAQSLKNSSKTAFVSGNFMFSVGEHAKEVPYDIHMYFTDEQNVAVRSWSHGYDLFNANEVACYHLWNNEKIKDTKAVRKLICDDNKKGFHDDAKSNDRECHLFGMKKARDEKVLQEIEKYNLGKERTLRDYERFSGIDFRKRKIREHTANGVFGNWGKVYKSSVIKNIFSSDDL